MPFNLFKFIAYTSKEKQGKASTSKRNQAQNKQKKQKQFDFFSFPEAALWSMRPGQS